MSSVRIRLVTAVAAAAVLAGTGAAPQVRAQDSCPIGQSPDDQDRWQCVHECPSGMLYDGQSGVCVVPPGVPPPALPQTSQIPEVPQIPQI